MFGKLAGAKGLDTTTTITLYVLLLVCNALMLVVYTRSLRYNSSLACTAATMGGWVGRGRGICDGRGEAQSRGGLCTCRIDVSAHYGKL